MADNTSDDDSLLIQASQEYEASLDGITNSSSHVLSNIEGQEEQCNDSEVDSQDTSGDDSYLLASQEYEASLAHDDSSLIQASQEYEASLDGKTNSPSHVSSDIEGQEELQCNDSDMDSQDTAGDDSFYLLTSQEYEASLTGSKASEEYAEQYLEGKKVYKNMDEDDFSYERLIKQPGSGPRQNRFSAPVSEEELLKKIKGAVPVSTKRSSNWAATVWSDWLQHRESIGINNEQLNYWLARFVVEAKNQKGETVAYTACVLGSSV